MISVSWASGDVRQPTSHYAVASFLVKKLTAEELRDKIRSKGIKKADFTKALVQEKLSPDGQDSELLTMSLKGSLLCPLGKMKLKNPCRAITCQHVQCFDALTFLQMNEKRAAWQCPVCDRPALFKDLFIG